MQRKQVVIVGAGFGGLAAAQGLIGASVDVTLIDRTNHHLFQPLLYQVATAALTPSDIASATRSLFDAKDNIQVLMDEVCGIDSVKREVFTVNSNSIPFDYLILATGADYNFFGNEQWAEHTLVLKTMEDALTIRERLLAAFERAEKEQNVVERSRLLTCVVVGGGPTGVEMAGAIAELGKTVLASNYRRISQEKIRVVLVEAGDRILSAFDANQSQKALIALTQLGVEVKLSSAVNAVDELGVIIGNERIISANVIWSAGTKARDSAKWLGADTAKNGSIIVNPDCSIAGQPGVFAIGDGASYRTQAGNILPGLAPVAKQQGRYVARLIRALASGKRNPPPFIYRNWGMMAVIGRSKAVADFGKFKLNGFLAWLTWSLIHLMLLIDFRSRSSVYISWSYAWFTRNRVAGLLTRKSLPNFEIQRNTAQNNISQQK